MNKLERNAAPYQVEPENKSRRKAIPTKDKRDTKRSATRTNRRRAVRNNLFIKALKENMPIVTLICSVWTSGFLAAKGEAFWSLLVFVLGIIVVLGMSVIKLENQLESEE